MIADDGMNAGMAGNMAAGGGVVTVGIDGVAANGGTASLTLKGK